MMISAEELKQKITRTRAANRRAMIGCGKGLVVSVSAGAATYYARYLDDDGRQRSVRLGDYQHLTLAKARERTREEIARCRQAKNKEKNFRTGYDTFLAYMESQVSEKRLANLETARRHLLTAVGDTPLNKIVPLEVVEKLRGHMSEANVYAMAGTLRQFMGFALNAGWIETNQCAGITSLCRRPQREGFAALPHDQLGEKFFAVLDEVNERYVQLILVTVLTALRLGSVREMQWDWVNLKKGLISLPGEAMKMRRAFRVPICSQLDTLLKKMQRFREGDFVIMGPRGGHLSTSTLQTIIRDRTAGAMTIHGIRKCVRTYLSQQLTPEGQLKYPFEVCEMVLAHETTTSMERVYNKDDYLTVRRAAMEDWGSYVLGQMTPKFRSWCE